MKKTLTEWSSPDEMIDSEYGKITYRSWCENEKNRINGHGDSVAIVTRETDNYITLSR